MLKRFSGSNFVSRLVLSRYYRSLFTFSVRPLSRVGLLKTETASDYKPSSLLIYDDREIERERLGTWNRHDFMSTFGSHDPMTPTGERLYAKRRRGRSLGALKKPHAKRQTQFYPMQHEVRDESANHGKEYGAAIEGRLEQDWNK